MTPSNTKRRLAGLLLLCLLGSTELRAQNGVNDSAARPPVAASEASSSARLIQAAAQRQELCTREVQPQIPPGLGDAEARYNAKVMVKDGKVQRLEVSVVQAPADRRISRALVESIVEAVRAYDCPGTFTFTQSFHFQGGVPSKAAPKRLES